MAADMRKSLDLPPSYVDGPLADGSDVFAIAKQFAVAGIEGGSLFHARCGSDLTMALVLAPEKTLQESLSVSYPLQLAMSDALGACLPPQVAVHFLWPDRMLLNAAVFGRLSLLAPETGLDHIPPWMVAGVTLRLEGEAKTGGSMPQTSLEAENLGDTDLKSLQESFARYFLNWLHGWEAGGVAALTPHYLARHYDADDPQSFPSEEGPVTGRVRTVAPDGGLILEFGEEIQVLPLSILLEESAREAPAPS